MFPVIAPSRRATLLWAATALAVIASACSSDAIPAPDPLVPTPTLAPIPTAALRATPTSQLETATATATPVATPAPKRVPLLGVLRTAAPRAPVHFDPHQEASPALITWGPALVYDRLFRFDPDGLAVSAALGSAGGVVCALCESWEMADLTTYRITLRTDAFWQDLPPVNGRQVVASDVVFSLRRQATPGWPNAGLLSNIESVAAIDPQTVEIVLERPDAELFELLADGHSVIVAQEAVSESGNLLEGPIVGSGPWLWKSTTESRSVFGANIAYYDPVRPGVTTLEIAYISPGTQFTSLLTGTIDFAQLGPEEFATATSRNTDLRVIDVPRSGVGLEFAINTGRGPFASLEARRSLLGALTPWQSLGEIWSDDAFVSVGLPVTNPDWLLPESELRTIFGEFASVPPTPLSLSPDITIKVGLFDERYQAQARRIADALSRLGATVMIEEVTTREFGDAVWFGGDYDLFLGSQPPVASLSDYLLAVYHSNGAWNTTGYSTPGLDSLIEAQAVDSDPAARRQTVLEIQRQIMAGAHRLAPASRVVRWVYWPFLENFNPSTQRADGSFLSAIRVGDRPPRLR